MGYGSVWFGFLHVLLSGLVRSLAKPGFWFSSFLLGLGYFPSLLKDHDKSYCTTTSTVNNSLTSIPSVMISNMIHHDSLSQMLIPQLSLPADELFDNILNLKSYKITAQTHIITTPYIVDHRRSQWSISSMPDCSARGPGILSCSGQLCLS